MFSTIEYTLVYPVDLKTGCPCQQVTSGESGLSPEELRGSAKEEPLRRLIPESRLIRNSDSAPRRGGSPFFGAWTDTRDE